RAGLDERTALLIGVRKTEDLDAALCIFEREDRHAVALLGLQLPHRGDDAADRGVGFHRLAATRAPLGLRGLDFKVDEFRGGSCAELPQFRRVTIGRVSAPVKTERLLLERELLLLGPRRR